MGILDVQHTSEFCTEVQHLKRCTVVTVSGRLDHTTAPELQKTLDDLVNGEKYNIIVDLSGCTYISAPVLRVLLNFKRVCSRWNLGALKLVASTDEKVRETGNLLGLPSILQTFDSLEEAVGSY